MEVGLLVALEARAGKEADAETFLKSAQPLALDEKGTLKWYAIKLGPDFRVVRSRPRAQGPRSSFGKGLTTAAPGLVWGLIA